MTWTHDLDRSLMTPLIVVPPVRQRSGRVGGGRPGSLTQPEVYPKPSARVVRSSEGAVGLASFLGRDDSDRLDPARFEEPKGCRPAEEFARVSIGRS